jgi:ribonuclease P protein component
MVLDATLPGPLVGYALGRHVGSAVARNRLRRQLRELVKNHEGRLSPGYYVISAGPKAAGQSSSVLGGSLAHLVDKCSQGAGA